jgi:DNA-binding CsgD family transcriptional regulator
VEEDLVDQIYAAAVSPELWPQVVRSVATAFDAHSGTLAFTENGASLSAVSASWGVFQDAGVVREYFSDFANLDTAVPLYVAQPTGKMVATSHQWTPDQLAKSVFYNEFFTRLGLVDSAGSNLIKDNRGLGIFCLQREAKRGAFSRGDLKRLERLAPHLRRALQLHRSFTPARRAEAALAEVLERMSMGVVAVDAAGRPWHVNAAAAEIARRGDGLTLDAASGLSAVDAGAAATLGRLLSGVLAGGGGAGGQVSVPRGDGRRSYSVLVSPLASPAYAPFDDRPRGGAVVLINDPDRLPPGDLQAVVRRFRLTSAEMALLESLLAGDSLVEHCDGRAISLNTGKFHLRALFSKTGARRQSDLVRIVMMAMRNE